MKTVQNTQYPLVDGNTVDSLPIICPLCTLSFYSEYGFEDKQVYSTIRGS